MVLIHHAHLRVADLAAKRIAQHDQLHQRKDHRREHQRRDRKNFRISRSIIAIIRFMAATRTRRHHKRVRLHQFIAQLLPV